MAWGPLTPAQIHFDATGLPSAPAYGDVYHPRAGALAQARQVFLAGNGLPGRWRGRARFVVLETGFGLGHNFLATAAAWRADAARPDRLVYLAIDKHPPSRDDLALAWAPHAADPEVGPLARALLAAWPPATPDLHGVDLDHGRLQLLLAWGDIGQVLPDLVARVDAFYLDGFAPDRNPAMWDARRLRGLNRLAAPEATVATWSVAGPVRRALADAGFEVHKVPGLGAKRQMSQGVFAPRHVPAVPPGRRGQPTARRVVVLGAGLAGAAAARALATQGLAVQVVEQHAAPAMATSGQAGGLLHGTVHAQDGAHARWLRAAALRARAVLAPWVASGRVPGRLDGLLRHEARLDAAAMQALLAAQGLPPDYVQVQPGAGPDGQPGWLYPGAGWVSPAALAAAWLDAPGITLLTGQRVQRLEAGDAGWRLLDSDGQTVAEADAVVLANAHDALRLLAGLGLPAWPVGRQRGQTTLLPGHLPALPALPLPVAGGGYALTLADGRLLCGATSQRDDDDPTLRAADHALNLATLARLTGSVLPPGLASAGLDGRVGWRMVTDDRLPLVGPVPVAQPQGPRLEQPRQVPRIPGLWLLAALGSRGLTQAALAGELLAAWLTEAPWPVPASLVDAVDPARFVARAARQKTTVSRS